jgi:hypothetical protein
MRQECLDDALQGSAHLFGMGRDSEPQRRRMGGWGRRRAQEEGKRGNLP